LIVHISIILAEKILTILNESGASEPEKMVSLDIAKSLVPVTAGSLHAKTLASDQQQIDSV